MKRGTLFWIIVISWNKEQKTTVAFCATVVFELFDFYPTKSTVACEDDLGVIGVGSSSSLDLYAAEAYGVVAAVKGATVKAEGGA